MRKTKVISILSVMALGLGLAACGHTEGDRALTGAGLGAGAGLARTRAGADAVSAMSITARNGRNRHRHMSFCTSWPCSECVVYVFHRGSDDSFRICCQWA